jgi:hypothetical protein
VWVLGFSAGGYGAQLQADRFRDAWPSVDLAILADGSPLATPYGGLWATWQAAWSPRLPSACTTCDVDLTAALEAQVADLPDARFGLVATRSDAVITAFFAYPPYALAPAVDALVDRVYVPDPGVEAFVVDGTEHVLLGDLTRIGAGGVVLGDWAAEWRDDAPGWTDSY